MSSSTLSAAPVLPWNEDLPTRPRGCSRYQASRELGWDFASFIRWLDGTTVPRPQTVRRAAGWLAAPAEDAARWEANAHVYMGMVRGASVTLQTTR